MTPTSRVLLAQTPPKGVDNVRWFQLRETLRRLNRATNTIGTTVEGVVTASGVVQPSSLIAPPVPARFRTAIGSNDYVQVQFGPVPAELSWVTSNFPYTSTALERPATSPHRETVCLFTFGAASVADTSAINFDFHAAIPRGFTGWGTEAVTLDYGLAVTGLAGASEGVVSLSATNTATGSALTAITQSYVESSGAISAAYPTKIAIPKPHMGTDWSEGLTLRLLLSFTLPNTHSGGTIRVGPLKVHWR